MSKKIYIDAAHFDEIKSNICTHALCKWMFEHKKQEPNENSKDEYEVLLSKFLRVNRSIA